MLDWQALRQDLAAAGLDHWQESLEPIVTARLSSSAHGDFTRWSRAVNALPEITPSVIRLDDDAVLVDDESLSGTARNEIRQQLLELRPWRKGPFRVCGTHIDSEWRSDWKWRRLADSIQPLQGRRVLDVGSGNGYYAMRMRGAGAKLVVGVDPTLLYIVQFAALNKLMRLPHTHLLPLRLHELPVPAAAFDTTFSMGVLYHQRNPDEHLRQLRDTLRPAGELVLETLVLPGEHEEVLVPEDRYARMRNVWHLPTVPSLEKWLASAGFENIRLIDASQTTIDEQRTTNWMTFESLRDALDPGDQDRTVEGLPAPTRAILTCSAPRE